LWFFKLVAVKENAQVDALASGQKLERKAK
jgi:hypothetical protein